MDQWLEDSPEFCRILRNETPVDLARVALEIARDYEPRLDLEFYINQINGVSERVRGRCSALMDPLQVIQQINWALFVEEEYCGGVGESDEPPPIQLHQVIDQGRGESISLCILYHAIAARLGVVLEGVTSSALHINGIPPSTRYVLRLARPGGDRFINPFHQELLDRRGCERRVFENAISKSNPCHSGLVADSPGNMIAFMLCCLREFHRRRGEVVEQVRCLRRLAEYLNESPGARLHFGEEYLLLGRLGEAVQELQCYLEEENQDEAGREIGEYLLRRAQREIALRN